jgi:hypothetical protein
MMNQQPGTQQHLEQQQQENQLLNCQKVIGKPEQVICTIQPTTPTAPTQLDPATFLQYAGTLAAIIQGITLLVVALTKFSRVFLALMGQKSGNKTQPTYGETESVKNNIS